MWPASLELSKGVVHTVLVITLLFLQERFLVRSDNLDELTKLGVTIVSLTFWSMFLITHIASLENSIGCVTDTAPFLKKEEAWFIPFNYHKILVFNL